jgi:hypothetical protein
MQAESATTSEHPAGEMLDPVDEETPESASA